MQLTQSIKAIILMAVVLVALAGYQFTKAQWTGPTAAPAGNNVAAPINTASSSQIKLGALGTGALSVTGDFQLTDIDPTIRFQDTDGTPYWIQNNAGTFYVHADRDNNGAWELSGYPLQIVANATTDYATFADQVRATSYCNRSGGDCFSPAQNSYKCKTDNYTQSISVPFTDSSARVSCGWQNWTCMANWCKNNGWDDAQADAASYGSSGSFLAVFGCRRVMPVTICGYY